jgi:5-hydroxyisourate hydrolase-like protein (transthyretin family)
MKKFIYLFIVLFALNLQAQLGNRGLRGNRNPIPQTQAKPKAPEFNVERYVGIVDYDVEKAAKKTGINLSSKEGKKFSTLLRIYNRDTNQIKRINSFTLRSTKDMVETFQQKAIETGDLSNQQKVRKTMTENLKPIVSAIRIEDNKLDEEIFLLLSDKKYKKWLKYNKKINKYIKPRKE